MYVHLSDGTLIELDESLKDLPEFFVKRPTNRHWFIAVDNSIINVAHIVGIIEHEVEIKGQAIKKGKIKRI